MVAALLPAAIGQPARGRISVQQVADALAASGIAVNSTQIELFSGITSAAENATMRVVSVSDQSAGAMKVKLRCQNNQQCLPFYVLVRGLDGKTIATANARALPIVNANALPQNVIHGGDRATLILESADSRMSLPVICLESGARGQKIHVASPDHRQFFDAEIVATGMLKGRL